MIFKFENAGYFFVLLFVLAVLGFWPSYFSKFFDGSDDFNFYFHFHAICAVLWIALLIIQPVLIHQGKVRLHRFFGKLSYVLIPLIFISVMLLAHHRIADSEGDISVGLWITFKDLLILGVAYGIAIYYRHSKFIHAKGMIAAGIVLIEPALIRFISHSFFTESNSGSAYLVTILLVYMLLIALIIGERNHKSGRWVFPIVLALYIFVHSVILLTIDIGPWKVFANWFASLPLT